MKKAALFDMDGVLIDSFEAWFFLFNKTLEHFGSKKLTKEEFNKGCWGVSSNIIGPKYFPNIPTKDIIEYYFKHFSEFRDKTKVLPGVENVLKELKKKGIKTAVITNTPHKQTEAIIKAVGLFRYFDIIVSFDDVKNGKPEPDMLFKACEELDVSADEAIFVGDTMPDIEAGKKAKIFTLGFKISAGNKRIDDIKELISII